MISIHDAKELGASVLLQMLNVVDFAVRPLSGLLVCRLNHVAKADRVENILWFYRPLELPRPLLRQICWYRLGTKIG